MNLRTFCIQGKVKQRMSKNLLDKINSPEDIKKLKKNQLPQLAKEVRQYIIETVSQKGGHLGARLFHPGHA